MRTAVRRAVGCPRLMFPELRHDHLHLLRTNSQARCRFLRFVAGCFRALCIAPGAPPSLSGLHHSHRVLAAGLQEVLSEMHRFPGQSLLLVRKQPEGDSGP